MTGRDDLRRIAEQLLIIADESGDTETKFAPESLGPMPNKIDSDQLTLVAVTFYRARQMRVRHLDENLFGEPAWDMLLDLFINKSNGIRTSVKSLCVASHVPETTALRWIGLLIDASLVARENDNTDRRRVFISLTPHGLSAIRRYLIDVTHLLRVVRLPPLMLVDANT